MDALAIFFAAVKTGMVVVLRPDGDRRRRAGSLCRLMAWRKKAAAQAVEKELGPKRAQKAHAFFERMGFWSIFIGALAPPPVPTGAIILVAGALEYPKHHFLAAITSARLIRYFVVTWAAAHYGPSDLPVFQQILYAGTLESDWSGCRRRGCRARVLPAPTSQSKGRMSGEALPNTKQHKTSPPADDRAAEL